MKLNAVKKIALIASYIAGIDTILEHFIDEYRQIRDSRVKRKKSSPKKQICPNSRFYGIFDVCCKDNLEFYAKDDDGTFFKCTNCKRLFEKHEIKKWGKL